MLRKLISGLLLLAALTTSLTGCGMDLAAVSLGSMKIIKTVLKVSFMN